MISLNEFRGIGFVKNISYYPSTESKKSFAKLTLKAAVNIQHPEKGNILVKRYAQIAFFDFLADKVSKLTIGTMVYVSSSLELRIINQDTNALSPTTNGNHSNGAGNTRKTEISLIGTGIKIISRTPTATEEMPTNLWSFNIIGRLGKINHRQKSNSLTKAFTNISLATDTSYRGKEATWKTITQWNYVNLFGTLADEIDSYPIGSLIQVSGYVNRVSAKPKQSTSDKEGFVKEYFNVLNAENIALVKLKKEQLVDISVPPPLL